MRVQNINSQRTFEAKLIGPSEANKLPRKMRWGIGVAKGFFWMTGEKGKVFRLGISNDKTMEQALIKNNNIWELGMDSAENPKVDGLSLGGKGVLGVAIEIIRNSRYLRFFG